MIFYARNKFFFYFFTMLLSMCAEKIVGKPVFQSWEISIILFDYYVVINQCFHRNVFILKKSIWNVLKMAIKNSCINMYACEGQF